MRIILTCNFSPWSPYSGGGQRSTHHIAVALSSRGHDVVVVYTKAKWERITVPKDLPYRVVWASFLGFESRRDAWGRPFSIFGVSHEVKKNLEGERTVVHAQGEEGGAVPFWRTFGYGFPFVVTPRYPDFPKALGDPHVTWQKKLLSAVTDPKYPMLGFAMKCADCVCPTSRHSLDRIARDFGVSRDRLQVVHNGVDPAFMSVDRAGDAHTGPLVFFGRLEKTKGTRELMAVIRKLGNRCPEVLIIGRGEEAEFIDETISKQGLENRVKRIAWMPSDELARILARASLVVLPSHEESFGNAMAETMAVGAPLISTTAGSIPEIVTNEETGILVPPGDLEALEEAISYLQGNPDKARAMGDMGREAARQRFSWDGAAAEYEAIYSRLL